MVHSLSLHSALQEQEGLLPDLDRCEDGTGNREQEVQKKSQFKKVPVEHSCIVVMFQKDSKPFYHTHPGYSPRDSDIRKNYLGQRTKRKKLYTSHTMIEKEATMVACSTSYNALTIIEI